MPSTPLGIPRPFLRDKALEAMSRCPATTQESQYLVTLPIVEMVRWVLDRLFRTPTYSTFFSASGDSSVSFDLSPGS